MRRREREDPDALGRCCSGSAGAAVALPARAGPGRAARASRRCCWRAWSATRGGRGCWSALVARGVLAVPAARRWLVRALRAARVRRAWWRAWTDCELPRVRAGRVSAIPAGELVRVRASRGSSLEHVEQRAEELAVCLQAREVRVARDPDNAATGTVTLVRRDPLAGMVVGAVAAPRRGGAVAVGADPGRRRRARRRRSACRCPSATC